MNLFLAGRYAQGISDGLADFLVARVYRGGRLGDGCRGRRRHVRRRQRRLGRGACMHVFDGAREAAELGVHFLHGGVDGRGVLGWRRRRRFGRQVAEQHAVLRDTRFESIEACIHTRQVIGQALLLDLLQFLVHVVDALRQRLELSIGPLCLESRGFVVVVIHDGFRARVSTARHRRPGHRAGAACVQVRRGAGLFVPCVRGIAGEARNIEVRMRALTQWGACERPLCMGSPIRRR